MLGFPSPHLSTHLIYLLVPLSEKTSSPTAIDMAGIVTFLKDTFLERSPLPHTPPPSAAVTATTTAASTRPATPTPEKDLPLLQPSRNMTGKKNSTGTVSAALNTAATTNIPADPYVWPHDGDLSASTALVIIDMQNDCE